MIDLFEATKEYWRKLDVLEIAYQNGDISLEEVDSHVAQLIQELGQKRRKAWQQLLIGLSTFFQDQQATVVGLAAVSMLTYAWLVIR